ncbi:MAG: penicillin-binding protein 2 [bacterium]
MREASAVKRKNIVRIATLYVVFVFIAAAILAKLAQLQIVEHGRHARRAERNAVRSVPLPLVRGEIVDANGTIIALDLPRIRRVKFERGGEWEAENVGFEEASVFMESARGPGRFVDTAPLRRYPLGELTAHVTGYLGEISREELAKWRSVGYMPGDLVGKAGVEREYETRLTGGRGMRTVRLDARGRILPGSRVEHSTKGDTLTLTLDVRLQRAAVEAMEGRKGAVVIMDVRTGGIVALVSVPAFDPGALTGGVTGGAWSELTGHPDHPLMNRAVSAAVPPGSVFKLVVAAGALEEGIATPRTTFRCGGRFVMKGKVFQCWRPGGHGRIDFETAVAQSCDVAFYQLGAALGIERIKKYGRLFGFGSKTGIDLPGEAIGLLPDDEWKRRFRGEGWYDGDTVNASIGQGYVQATPLQMAVMTSAIAAGGMKVAPRLVRGGGSAPEKLPLSEETLAFLKRGMRAAVTRGTCAGMKTFPAPTAAKTGTADDPPREKPHAWFTGFVPADEPRLAWAVFVENGGTGAAAALPVARTVLEKAFEIGYFKDYETAGDDSGGTTASAYAGRDGN